MKIVGDLSYQKVLHLSAQQRGSKIRAPMFLHIFFTYVKDKNTWRIMLIFLAHAYS